MSGVYIGAAIGVFILAVIGYLNRTFKDGYEETGFILGASIQLALMIIPAILL